MGFSPLPEINQSLKTCLVRSLVNFSPYGVDVVFIKRLFNHIESHSNIEPHSSKKEFIVIKGLFYSRYMKHPEYLENLSHYLVMPETAK